MADDSDGHGTTDPQSSDESASKSAGQSGDQPSMVARIRSKVATFPSLRARRGKGGSVRGARG